MRDPSGVLDQHRRATERPHGHLPLLRRLWVRVVLRGGGAMTARPSAPRAVVDLAKPAWCRNCAARLAWHVVGQRLVHAASGHMWCFEDQQGYDQPKATA